MEKLGRQVRDRTREMGRFRDVDQWIAKCVRAWLCRVAASRGGSGRFP
jgi:hypothetical protein